MLTCCNNEYTCLHINIFLFYVIGIKLIIMLFLTKNSSILISFLLMNRNYQKRNPKSHCMQVPGSPDARALMSLCETGHVPCTTPKVNKTVQLRLQILKFWLFPHTDENGVILLPHAYRMWNKNSFNKIVIDFISWCVKIWTIFRNFMPCNICYVGQGGWFT